MTEGWGDPSDWPPWEPQTRKEKVLFFVGRRLVIPSIFGALWVFEKVESVCDRLSKLKRRFHS